MDETIRLDTNTITYGAATKDVVLTESREDVIRLRKSKPDTYVIHKGEHVCLPYRAVHHGAATLQDGPGAFNPGGFSSVSNPKAPSSNDADAVQTNAFRRGSDGLSGQSHRGDGNDEHCCYYPDVVGSTAGRRSMGLAWSKARSVQHAAREGRPS